MYYWFVAYSYRRNAECAMAFANCMMTTLTDDFSFMRAAQDLADRENLSDVVIINWKKLSLLEYDDCRKFAKTRDVSN